jgi:large subunit ribosomal protein L20
MARIKRRQIRSTRLRKLFKRAKGFHLARKNTLRQTKEALLKARSYAFRGRKEKKRAFRSMWIARLNAALRPRGLSYSRFMHGVSKAGVTLDRKALSELAIHDPAAFDAVVETARAALA